MMDEREMKDKGCGMRNVGSGMNDDEEGWQVMNEEGGGAGEGRRGQQGDKGWIVRGERYIYCIPIYSYV